MEFEEYFIKKIHNLIFRNVNEIVHNLPLAVTEHHTTQLISELPHLASGQVTGVKA